MELGEPNLTMYKLALKKADGRNLILYARAPITNTIEPISPRDLPQNPDPHFRWHPLRGEWVAYAAYRQDRTFLPNPEYNPLAPTGDPAHPTELPAGTYDVAVFENSFPSMSLRASGSVTAGIESRPANGICEVMVYTQDPLASLGSLPLEHIELLLEVWGDRYKELGAHPAIEYVMPFENRGVEVGVTLHHPHGQIYAYPFVPSIPAKELEQQSAHFKKTGRSLLQDVLKMEIDDGRRIIYKGPCCLAFVPAFARYPYELWIVPNEPLGSVSEFTREQRSDFARALKTVLLKYDGLWNRSFPYVMLFHQAPTTGSHPEAHFHIEFYPPYRSRERLKYLAGTEIGAGMFTNDTLPEQKAAELQDVKVSL